MADTVMVGCRVPNGVRLRVYDRVDSLEVPGTKVPREVGEISLPGPVSQHGEKMGQPPEFTETPVDAKLFALWMKENDGTDLSTSGMVFDADKARKDAADEAQAEANKAKAAEAPKAEPAKAPVPATATPAPAPTPAPAAK